MKKKILIICLTVFLVLIAIISAILIIKNQINRNEEKNLECKQAIQEILEQNLNLSSNEFLIGYNQCNLGRGGNITVQSASGNLGIFYHWGWCSSGGTDCGFSICFSGSKENTLYNKLKNETFRKINESLSQYNNVSKEYRELNYLNQFETTDALGYDVFSVEYISNTNSFEIKEGINCGAKVIL